MSSSINKLLRKEKNMIKLIKLVLIAALMASGAMAVEPEASDVYDRSSDYLKDEYRVKLGDRDVYDADYHYFYKQKDGTYYSISFSREAIFITKGPDDHYITDGIYVDSREVDIGTLSRDSSSELGIIDFGSLRTRKDASIESFTQKELYDLFSAIKNGTAQYMGRCLAKGVRQTKVVFEFVKYQD